MRRTNESRAQTYNLERLREATTINQSRRGKSGNNLQRWSWLFIGAFSIDKRQEMRVKF